MPSIVGPDGVTYQLPADDSVAQKVPSYNAAIMALAGGFTTGAAWTSWTPTLTNIAIGTGGSAANVGKYFRVGKLVVCRLSIILGTAGASVSGSVSFSLPVTRAANAGSAGGTAQGMARLFDTSAGTTYEASVCNLTTTTSVVIAWDASAAAVKQLVLSSTVPFTWAASDEINCQFWYEAA